MENHNFKALFHIAVLEHYAGILKATNCFQARLINLHFEGKARLGSNLRQTRQVLDSLKKEVACQVRFEKTKLFPFLVRHIPKLEPAISFLKAEHGEFNAQIKYFEKTFEQFRKAGLTHAETSKELFEAGRYLICLLRHHIQAENKIYAAMTEDLRDHERVELKDLFETEKSHERPKKGNQRVNR